MVNSCFCLTWDAITAVANVVTSITAICASIVAFKQYRGESKRSKEATRSKILSDYNKYYAQNYSIRVVTKALIDNNFDDIHSYDVEIFLRFFEEIYLLIHCEDRMKAPVAKYMFAYYAIQAWENNTLWELLVDEDHPTKDSVRAAKEWFLFRLFVDEMKLTNSDNISI